MTERRPAGPAYAASVLEGEWAIYALQPGCDEVKVCRTAAKEDLTVDNTIFFTDDPANIHAIYGKDAVILLHLTEKTEKLSFSEYPYAAEEAELPEMPELLRVWCRAKGLPPVIAETERLLIREFVPEDLDLLYAIYEDAEGIGPEERLSEDREEERARLEDLVKYVYPLWGFGLWLVLRKCDGVPVGRMGLFIREGEEIPELGYTVRRSLRGQGYAKEALKAILDWAKAQEIGTVTARCTNENGISAHLLRTLGFVVTACDERKTYWKKTGQPL